MVFDEITWKDSFAFFLCSAVVSLLVRLLDKSKSDWWLRYLSQIHTWTKCHLHKVEYTEDLLIWHVIVDLKYEFFQCAEYSTLSIIRVYGLTELSNCLGLRTQTFRKVVLHIPNDKETRSQHLPYFRKEKKQNLMISRVRWPNHWIVVLSAKQAFTILMNNLAEYH